MWKRIKENAPAAAAMATVFIVFAAIVQLGVLNPIQQRIDDLQTAMNQRFDSIDDRTDGLSGDVSELRRLSDRVSRNEGRIDAVTQQLQAIDAPAP